MSQFILDTDHISLFQRGNPLIRQRIAALPPEQIFVTIISFEEQVRGWLAQIKRAKDEFVVARRYRWLRESLDFFSIMRVLDFDETAAEQFGQLRQLRLRVGTQDLRIAAIALTTYSIVITRNARDFSRVPGLQIEDWSR